MGLAERRACKAFQENRFPELKRKIDEAAGFPVALEVAWDSLTLDERGVSFEEDWYLTDIFFLPLVEALKGIAVDEMGKQALKTGLKKVVMKYDRETAPISNYRDGWKFENGVLVLNYEPGVNSDGPDGSNFKERVEAIRKNLEEKL